MPKHSDRRLTRRWAKSGPPLRGRVRKPAGLVMIDSGKALSIIVNFAVTNFD
jgi:hypothetical protein